MTDNALTSQALQSLLDWLDDAIERQENLLAVCVAQGEAALAHNRPELEARNAALALLMREAADAERVRERRVLLAAEALGVGGECPRLQSLIAAAPTPWNERLAEAQARLREVLNLTRVRVRENSFVVRRNLQRINQVFEAMVETAPQAGYRAPGAPPIPQERILLDARG